METDRLSREIEAAQHRLRLLDSRPRRGRSAQEERTEETLTELRIALEELRVAEEELRQQNEELLLTRAAVDAERRRYQDLFEAAPEGYLVTDGNGTIREANQTAASLLNIESRFLIGKPLLLYIAESDRLAFQKRLTQILVSRRTQEWEIRLQPRWGESFDSSLTVSSLPGEKGCSVELRWMLRDITERKQHEATLRAHTNALISLLNALAAGPELTAFLDQALTVIARFLHAESVMLWRAADVSADPALQMHYAQGKTQRFAPSDPLPPKIPPLEPALMEEMRRTRLPVLVRDVAREARIANPKPWLERGVVSLLLVPLLYEQGVLGWFRIAGAQDRVFNFQEIQLAQALAQQVALALRMTDLAAQGRHAAVLAERNRIAQEIHDTLAQGFTGIALQLEAAEEILPCAPGQAQAHLRRARDLAQDSLVEARRSVMDLRTTSLHGRDFPEAFAAQARQRLEASGIELRFHCCGTPRALDVRQEHNLLRIGQEALTNALKHSQAKEIRVEFGYEAQQVWLRIQDDGRGFAPEQASAGGGFGVIGMRERARQMQGHLTISSQPGEGTEVLVVLPAPALPEGE